MAIETPRDAAETMMTRPYSDCGAEDVPFQGQAGTGATSPYQEGPSDPADDAVAAATLLAAVKRSNMS